MQIEKNSVRFGVPSEEDSEESSQISSEMENDDADGGNQIEDSENSLQNAEMDYTIESGENSNRLATKMNTYQLTIPKN